MTEPSYVKLFKTGELEHRVEEALALLTPCRLCPRECGVNRISGEHGRCRTGGNARVASYYPHFGEEPPLVGRHGSGTIFFSSCNLLCVFCQNYEISHGGEGFEVEPSQLAAMMLELQERGCHNINFVTPTHVMPQILEGLTQAARTGLRIPLVYNSGGYDSVESLRILDGIIDIYMPDFKFWDNKWAERYCRVSDYREKTAAAVKEMCRQVGDLDIDASGVAVKGLLVRHLVMPNGAAGTPEVMSFLADDISRRAYVNVMAQYRPCGGAMEDEYINRPITRSEFHDAVFRAQEAGLPMLRDL